MAHPGGRSVEARARRQVPPRRARSDRAVRAVLPRLGGRSRQPRPGPRQCGARGPGGHGPARDRPAVARVERTESDTAERLNQRVAKGRPWLTSAPRPRRRGGNSEIAPRYREATMTLMNSISAAAPTVTRPVGRRPVTRLVSRTRDRSSEPPRAIVRIQFRDRRPRDFPVRSRGGVGRRYASPAQGSNGSVVPVSRRPSAGGSPRRRAAEAWPPFRSGRKS